ncbi:FG-GAP-like repeat-containing protein [Cylindrospermopsis raciborskii]|uniref:FG-GAP-like repeat-containing protein n=1 Tax=Cylindrospermopsis raciborskii TaxID=77022 RepID=UPI001BA95246|nr:FG-GAP-like repeat-containing protein [Cylindrospermopsis raciborskii]
MTPLINQALSLVYTQLSYFSESSNYYQVLSTAFGNNYDRDIAEKLKLHWQQVNFTQIPQIEILDGGILGSAYGAYARETNKIYLSRNFVTNNTAEVIGRVILEEVGHFVDGQLNVEDSEGDEGAIFAELVVGNSLDDQALRKLRTESDFGIITLNGQQVHVEQSSSLSLPGVYYSSVAWADYDGDGKQDFLLTGFSSNNSPLAKLYKNTGNGFKEDTTVSLPGVRFSSVAWADYDGDGKQDFLLTGFSSNNSPLAKLYRNTGNGFEEDTTVSLPGVRFSSVAWADYDGDGKQDFLLTGDSSDGRIAKLYRNTGNGFKEDTNVSLPGVYYSSVAWADYDGDGKQDFLLTGDSSDGLIAKLYRNTGNGFEEDTTVSLPGVRFSSVAWADYDGDGKQDFLLTGFSSNNSPLAKLYRNTGNGFKEDTNVSLPGVAASSVAWADYDGDGKQDFLLTGDSSDGLIAKLYRNTGNGFEEDTTVSLPGVRFSSVAWADYDGDGKQDFLLTGDSSDGRIAKLYRNTGSGFTETLSEANEINDVTLAVSPGKVNEDGRENLVYTFTRRGDLAQELTVTYNIRGTADARDYIGATPGEGKTIKFTANSPTVKLEINPTADNLSESNETVRLTLVEGDGYTVGTTTPITGTIKNDDLPGVYYSSVAWADYNGDGKQDFLLTGLSSNGRIAKLYRNTGNGFEDTTVSLPGVSDSSVAWADYDGDGKQDFLLTGFSSDGPIAKLYRNTGNGFKEDTNVSLPGVAASSVAWADYDGDGRQDFLLTGFSSNGRIAKLYRNTGNGFKEDTNVSLPGVAASSVAWADYDGDGKQDFLLTGDSSDGLIAKLYRNTGNGFEEDTTVSLPGVRFSSVAWADYDGDGKQDFLLTGDSSDGRIAKLYRNTGNGFKEDTNVSLPGVAASSVAWADYDGDGKQDFLLTGDSSDGLIAKLYRNTGNGFEEDTTVSLPGVRFSSVAWADYDGDGKQDFLLTGDSSDGRIAKLYRNTGSGFTETLSEANEINDVTLAVSPGKVNEDGRENLVYTFTRRGDLAQELTVTYNIRGTADARDYIGATPGEGKTIKFTANSPTVKLEINPTADNLSESNETVRLTLVEGDGYTVGTTTPITGTIKNDDLPGVYYSSVAWADYNGDGKQDFLLTGLSSNGRIAKLYRNTGNGFEDTTVSLPGVSDSSVAWADYDGDGKQDFLLTGFSSDGPIAKLYRNTGNGFKEDTNVSLPGVRFSSVAWADYDGDRKQDFLLTGFDGSNPIAKLYRNTGNGFEDKTPKDLPGVSDSSVAWADYDKDGDQDFLLTGDSSDGRIAKLYRNTGNGFEEDTNVSLPGVAASSVAWADYDKDGDQDFLLTGFSSDFTPIAKLYKNTGNGFEEDTNVSLPGVVFSSVVWADYDKDGDQDFLLTGSSSDGRIAKLYRNTGNGFEEDTNVSLPGVAASSVVWADYDKDGDQDFLLTGDSSDGPIAKLYRNTGSGFTETLSEPNEINDVTLAVSPTIVNEDGRENLVYTFTRRGDLAQELTVTYEIHGTADARDYIGATPGEGKTIKFTANSPTVKLEINPTADNLSESNETVRLTLVEGDGYTVGTTTPITGTIKNDDLPGVYYSSVAWADYNGDGKQDFLLTGLSSNGRIAKLYKNTGNGFEEDTNVSLPGVEDSSVAWADYDGDGKQDFLLTGFSSNGPIAKLYRNTGNGFEEKTPEGLPGVRFSSVAWADYDGDRKQDFLLTGFDGSNPIAKLYRNTGNGFEDKTPKDLPGVSDSSVAWADYDKDGDQDFLLTGFSSNGPIAKLYRNTGNGFEDKTPKDLPGVSDSSVAWADYDKDGDQDFLLTGLSSNGRIAKLYKNTGNGFEEDTNALPGVYYSSVAWADYNGDGRQDFLLTGFDGSNPIAKLYKNTGNGFEEDTNALPGVYYSSVAWADYDGDGRQDFLLTGFSSDFTPIAKLYRNTGNGFKDATDINIGKIDKFPGVEDSSVAWSKDGKYFLLTGFDGSKPIAKLYTSEGNGLFKESQDLPGVIGGSVAWSKDGKYFLLTGWDGSESVAKLYENTDNGFKEPSNVSLTGVYNSSVAWADYDKDGDQDFVLTGWDGSRSVAKLYENTGNGFKEPSNVSLTGVYNSSVAWSENGEYLLLTGQSASGLVSTVYKNSVENGSRRLLVTDNPVTGVENGSVAWSKDGEYFLLTGWDGSKSVAKLYKKNKDGKFEEDNSISLPGVRDSSVAWADYDGDGKQDFILTGLSSDGRISKLYKKNKDGKFEEDNSISLPGLALGSVNWGDYDGDGRQDLLLTGESDYGRISQVYRNTSSGDKTFFTATLSPTGLPDITLAVSNTIVEEGKKLVYTFTRTGDLTQELTVTYDRRGTADFSDYIGIISGSAVFKKGKNNVELEITTRQDRSSEGDETLELTLSQSQKYTVGTNTPVKGIIRDAKQERVPLITSIPKNMEMLPKNIKPGEELSKLSYQFLDYNSPTVRAKLDSALNLTNSVFTNFLGLYEVDDPNTGAVNGFFPGDPGYAEAALSRRVQNFHVKAGGSATNITTNGVFAQNQTPVGDPSKINDVRYLAPFLIANIGSRDISKEDLIKDLIGEINNRKNSSANYQNESVAYFSFGAANPGGMSQIKHFGNGIFGFEDLPLNVSDRDFNDTVFSFG